MRLLAMLGIAVSMAGCYHGPRGQPVGPTQAPVVQQNTGITLGEAEQILLGQHVDASVRAGDPKCFLQWDSTGSCRSFELVATTAGTFTATVKWTSGEWIDVFLIPRGRGYIYSNQGRPSTGVQPGDVLGIVVMSYTAPQNFSLDTGIQP